MGRQATAEQQHVVDTVTAGWQRTAVEAGAGTGKTSTLELLAGALRGKGKLLYTQFLNDGGISEAKKRFPSWVSCRTSHSLAFTGTGQWVRDRFSSSRDMGRIRPKDQAAIIGITASKVREHTVFNKESQMMNAILATIERFCYSADPVIGPRHVPADLARSDQTISRWAQVVWEQEIARPEGRLPLGFDHYQKLWQLGQPAMGYDMIMLDEAQDTNPCVADVVKHQDCQVVMVGDPNQQMYAWRMAEDAMARIAADQRAYLTGSFRFGPQIAAEANRLLAMLGASYRLTGLRQGPGTVGRLCQADAVLCRTNAEALRMGMELLRAGHKVGLSKKVMGELLRFAKAGLQLRRAGETDHPDLFRFGSWAELEDYARNDHGGSDLATFVRLVSDHGEQLVKALEKMIITGCGGYDIVCSTTHRAKGQEWPLVAVAPDFDPPEEARKRWLMDQPAFLQMCYVAVTRAQEGLDAENLRWVGTL